MKQQPVPDEFADSTQHPVSRARVQYIHENHAKNGWWVRDEDIDMNLMNARHGPEVCENGHKKREIAS